MAGFVAAILGAAVVVLGLGLIRVHPLLAVGLNPSPSASWRRPSGVGGRSGAPLVRPGALAGAAVGWVVLALGLGGVRYPNRSAVAGRTDLEQTSLPPGHGRARPLGLGGRAARCGSGLVGEEFRLRSGSGWTVSARSTTGRRLGLGNDRRLLGEYQLGDRRVEPRRYPQRTFEGGFANSPAASSMGLTVPPWAPGA